MSALDVLRRPAVRIPLMLVLLIVAGAFAAHSCAKGGRVRQLGQHRHLRFMEMVFRLCDDGARAGRRPKSLAEVAAPYSCGEMSAIEDLYLRGGYSRLPEFALPVSRPATEPRLKGLGRVEILGEEILWEGYCYRLWPAPGSGRDFLVFGWPEAPGAGRLTEACLSTEPDRLYYTFAMRYAGPGAGPRPEDLGDPFGGRVSLMPLPGKAALEDFLERAGKSNGREWALMEMARGGGRPPEPPPPAEAPLDGSPPRGGPGA